VTVATASTARSTTTTTIGKRANVDQLFAEQKTKKQEEEQQHVEVEEQQWKWKKNIRALTRTVSGCNVG
jgi:hypothetical protein